MLATSTVTTSMDDIILWADTTWCFREELEDYNHMSDDYTVLRKWSMAWDEFLDPDHMSDQQMFDALESHLPYVQTSANWDELHVATTGDTYLDRDPITGVVYYDHLGDQDVSDIPF